jgi:glycosyltransferase involved in cell wall biosynthesis
MKVAIYNLYWSTYGGGEQVAAAAAEHLLNAGHEVVAFGPEPLDIEMTTRRLGRDLSRCGYQRVTNDVEASDASAGVDVFINCTYLSSAIPRSPRSMYYVHFPGVPLTNRRKVSSTLSTVGHRTLSPFASLPGPLEGVRAGFARRIHDVSWGKRYTVVAANSAFTAEWVQRLWGVDADILYPPVEVVTQRSTGGHLVMSLGRFFDRSFGHCKKQDVLLDAWELIEQRSALHDWSVRMIGGADRASRDYVLDLRRRALDLRAEIAVNAPRDLVLSTLGQASIFWHAAGFGEDPSTHPDRFEHFGIAVVEAMSAGLVPIVFGAAGPSEIVRHGVDGYHWSTVDELIELTELVASDSAEWSRLSQSARERAQQFSDAVFDERLLALLK